MAYPFVSVSEQAAPQVGSPLRQDSPPHYSPMLMPAILRVPPAPPHVPVFTLVLLALMLTPVPMLILDLSSATAEPFLYSGSASLD